MKDVFEHISELVSAGDVIISAHGYDELADDGIFVRDMIDGIRQAMPIESYPEYHKGPSVLMLHKDRENKPVHVVWGVPKGNSRPAVLITAYRPDPKKWSDDFQRRKR